MVNSSAEVAFRVAFSAGRSARDMVSAGLTP